MSLWFAKTLLSRTCIPALAVGAMLVAAQSGTAFGQTSQAPPAPAPAVQSGGNAAPAPAAETQQQDSTFTSEELRKLLAPYALYPDSLLAQLLPASAYPLDIVQASRWLSRNKAVAAKDDYSGLDQLDLDPTVKALARFPTVLEQLNTDLTATSDMGDAFVNQPSDVAAMIQELRRAAQAAGTLKTTKQQRVRAESQDGKSYVVIEPAEPGVVYVPEYDSSTAYTAGAGLLGFGLGVFVGAGMSNYWNWGNGWAYPPRWGGYGPGYGRFSGRLGSGDINIGNRIDIGGDARPWRPDSGRYRPGQGTKPDLGRPGRGNDRARVADRMNRGGNRTQIGNGLAGNRPGLGNGLAVNRPGLGAGNRLQGGRAQQRPARRAGGDRRVRDTAFGDARMGGRSSNFASQRGLSSRNSASRPSGFGGGRGGFGGGGGRHGGFGGGGRHGGFGGGGGGRRFGGGGGRRGR